MKPRIAKKEEVHSGTTAAYFKDRSICLLSEALLLLDLSKQQHLMELNVFSSGRAFL